MTQDEYDVVAEALLYRLKSFSLRTRDAGEHSVAKLAELIIEATELNKSLYDSNKSSDVPSRE